MLRAPRAPTAQRPQVPSKARIRRALFGGLVRIGPAYPRPRFKTVLKFKSLCPGPDPRGRFDFGGCGGVLSGVHGEKFRPSIRHVLMRPRLGYTVVSRGARGPLATACFRWRLNCWHSWLSWPVFSLVFASASSSPSAQSLPRDSGCHYYHYQTLRGPAILLGFRMLCLWPDMARFTTCRLHALR